MLHDIRNPTGRLVCRIDADACIVEIFSKGCLTRIQWTPEGNVRITHARRKTLTT